MENQDSTADRIVPVLTTLGLKEISNEAVRKIDFKEIIEYYSEGRWRMFARR